MTVWGPHLVQRLEQELDRREMRLEGKARPGLVNLNENIFMRVVGHETSVPSLACTLSMCERKSL